MTLDQLSRFLSDISNERLYPIIYLTALYGLRRSEILGIKWDSINYEQMTLTIKHTYVEGKKIYEKDTTKNDSSYRTYPISPAVKDLFEKQKQDEQQKLLAEEKQKQEQQQKQLAEEKQKQEQQQIQQQHGQEVVLKIHTLEI